MVQLKQNICKLQKEVFYTGYKSTQEMIDALKDYNAAIEEMPETFEVHNEYLIAGMTVDNFITGYKAYRNIIIKLNQDMISDPESFGLVVCDKKGALKPVNAIYYPYLWLFIALALSGEMKDGKLYVSGPAFLEYTKGKPVGSHNSYPKNVDSLIHRLGEYHFNITGYKHGENSDFTVEYTDNVYLLPVIKASTLTSYQAISLLSDYACFNFLMFKTASKERMIFSDTHTAKIMPVQLVENMNTIIDEFGKIGFAPAAERHHKHDMGWIKFKYYQVYYGLDRLCGILDIHDLYKHEKYLETLPERYLNLIKENLKCKGCKKGECNWRRTDELFGKKRVWCNSSGYLRFYFPTGTEDTVCAAEIIANIHSKKIKH